MENELIEKRGVQSIGVGLQILGALTKADAPLTLTAVSRASGVPSSSCHRYLTSFIKAGYVAQDAASGRYALGSGIIEAGLAALRRADPIVVGLAACGQLAEKTGRTAQLAIWSSSGPVIVSWRMGHVPVPTNLSVGSRLPLLNSATGRAFLAHLPPAYWQAFLKEEGGTESAARQISSKVRKDGYAVVAGELIPGLAVAAAPLLDARAEPAAVIALLGLQGQLTKDNIKELLSAVAKASADLGYAPDNPI